MLPLLLTTSLLHPVTVSQDHVLPVFGCGAGCRIETEQLALPEPIGDGWIRLKVRQTKWLNVCNLKTYKCWDEPASGRLGPPVQEMWLFANCGSGLFSASQTPERAPEHDQPVFNSDGSPIHQTVHGNPLMRWAKLCPNQSRDGMKYMNHLNRKFWDALEQIKRNHR